MTLDKLTKSYVIKSNTKLGNTKINRTAIIVMSESQTFNKFFDESDIISSKFSAIYHLQKFKIKSKVYVRNIDTIKEDFKEFSLPNKRFTSSIANTLDALIDISLLTKTANSLSLVQQTSVVNETLEKIITSLKKSKFNKVQIVYIVDPNSTKSFNKQVISTLNLPYSEMELEFFLAGRNKDNLMLSKLGIISKNTNTKIKEIYNKFLSFFPNEDINKTDETTTDIAKDMSISSKSKIILNKLYKDGVITDEDLKTYSEVELLSKIVAESLADANTLISIRTYDEEKFQKALKDRIASNPAKTVLKREKTISNSTVVKGLNEHIQDRNVVNEFRSQYDEKVLNSDIQNVLGTFENDDDYPMVLTDVKIKDTSSETTLKKTVTSTYKDSEGKSFKVNLDIPTTKKDKRTYVIDGTNYTMVSQLISKVINKINEDEIAVTSNYNKTFIKRMSELSVSNKTRSVKAALTDLIENTGKFADDAYFDAESSIILHNVQTTSFGEWTYEHSSTLYEKLEKLLVKFNIAMKKDISEYTDYLPVAYSGKDDKTIVLFIDKKSKLYETDLKGIKDLKKNLINLNTSFANFMVTKTLPNKVFNKTYSRYNIVGQNVALIIGMMCKYSLRSIFKEAKISYKIMDINDGIKSTQNERVLKLKDSKLVIKTDELHKELLVNFLTQNRSASIIADLTLKELFSLNKNKLLLALLSEKTIIAVKKFFEGFVDPITKELLEKDMLPTDTLELFVYVNYLLSKNNKTASNSFDNFRIRNGETIPAMMYRYVKLEHSKFAETYKRSRFKKDLKFSVPKNALMNSFTNDLPNVQTYSSGNPYIELEESMKIGFSGFLGINNNDSISFDMRRLDPSQRGIIDPSAVLDNAGAGATKYMSIGMGLKDLRGTFEKYSDEDIAKIANENPSQLLGITNNLEPMIVRSDSSRTSMGRIQALHSFPSETTLSKPFIRTGTEETIVDAMGDSFVIKATKTGTITKIDEKAKMIYIDKTTKVSYANKVLLNGSAGFSIDSAYHLVSGLKVGMKVKEGQKLALSNSTFVDDVLSVQGKLSLVSFIPDVSTNEDASYVSASYAKTIALPYVKTQSVTINEEQELLSFAKIGDKVTALSQILSFKTKLDKNTAVSDEKVNTLFGDLFDDETGININADYTGEIVNMKFVYNKAEGLLSKGEKDLIAYLEAENRKNNTTGVDSKVIKDKAGFILGKPINNAGILFYDIKKIVKGKSGNKLTIQSTKAVFNVIPDEEMPKTQDGRVIDVVISSFSLITRMTIGSLIGGIYLNQIMKTMQERLKVLVETDIEKSRKQLVDLIKIMTTNDTKKFKADYLKTFTSMTNKDLKEFITNDFSIIMRPFKDPSLKLLKKFADDNNIVVEERLMIPDNGKYYKAKIPSVVGYTYVKHLVQTVDKNNVASHDVDEVDTSTGGLTSNSKVVQFSMDQSTNIFSSGLQAEVLPEITNIRSDNIDGRIAMERVIAEKGEVTLKEIATTGVGGSTKLVSIMLTGAGYSNDLAPKVEVKGKDIR